MVFDMKRTECNLCGSHYYEIVYENKDSDSPDELQQEQQYRISEGELLKPQKVFKCNVCNLIFAELEERDNYYSDKYERMIDGEYLAEERGRRLASDKILSRIMKYKDSGKLLDIGCANGFFLDQAKKKGFAVQGVELSEWAAQYAREKLQLDVFQGTLSEAAFPDGSFDVVVMLDVIEHLVDPKEMLLEIRRILKRDGILYISTPNIASFMSRILQARWWGINKYHLYYFSKQTLERMLDACGFKVRKYLPHLRIFSVNYWARRCASYSSRLFTFLDTVASIGKVGHYLLKINLHDQLEVIVVKARKLDFLAHSLTVKKKKEVKENQTVTVVLPAYNAEKTLQRTVEDIPRRSVQSIILVDDHSSDRTVAIAHELGLRVYRHSRNKGYGANQKTCYAKALEAGADIIVMVHPDYQYDPSTIPRLIRPIQLGEADAVFGSRMMKGGALEGGMPLWKHNVNILLTAFENVVLGTFLTEYHSGFRAYSADYLKTVNFEMNSDKFVFDTEIIVQGLIHHFKIEEIPIQTRYFDEASKIKFWPSVAYGLGIVVTMIKYLLHKNNLFTFKQFE